MAMAKAPAKICEQKHLEQLAKVQKVLHPAEMKTIRT
jgi:hypothetical protein